MMMGLRLFSRVVDGVMGEANGRERGKTKRKVKALQVKVQIILVSTRCTVTTTAALSRR